MKNARGWTENKFELFAEVLADPENNFVISLENLALKKSANNEVFEHIKNTFELQMDNEIFKQNNVDQVKDNATKLETSIHKLRQKYKWLKQEWTSRTNLAKNGSGLQPEQ